MTVSVRAKRNFSYQLRAKLQLAFPPSSDDGDFFREGKDYRDWYKGYLVTIHTMIRASVPLMAAAETRSMRLDNDQLCVELAKYYNRHAKEEAEHDKWLLADLQAIGLSNKKVLSRKPIEAVAELVGSQYYWIHHWHPVCLLGYIAVMEGYPPDRRTINELISKTRYPKEAFRTLAKHSYLDPHHRKDLDTTLDGLPLSDEHEEWITLNAIYTLRKWSEIAASI
jgi:hypothetical protein